MRGLSSQARGISGDSSSVHRAYPIKVCTSVDQMTVPGQQNPTLFRVRQLAKTCESKLEQLEKEVQSIRDAVSTRALPVEPSLPTASSPPMPSSHVPFSTFPDRPSIPVVSIPEQVPTPSQSTAYTTPTGPVKRPSEPRALLSRVFSGESIDHYFDQYVIILLSRISGFPVREVARDTTSIPPHHRSCSSSIHIFAPYCFADLAFLVATSNTFTPIYR